MKANISFIPAFLVIVGMQFVTNPKPQFNFLGLNWVLLVLSILLFFIILYSFLIKGE